MLTILHTQRNKKNMINQNLTPRKCDPIVSFSDRFVTIEHLFRIFNNNIAPKNIYFVRNPYFFIFFQKSAKILFQVYLWVIILKQNSR